MKEPRPSDVKIDEEGTKRIRRKMAGPKAIKITINIDGDTLAILRAKSAETGVPYQRLLNRLLTTALQNERESKSRLDRLEQEVARLKRRIVA
jgi:predicted DNA binding CopG/RHH family protein